MSKVQLNLAHDKVISNWMMKNNVPVVGMSPSSLSIQRNCFILQKSHQYKKAPTFSAMSELKKNVLNVN